MGRTTAQNFQKEAKTRGIAGRSPKSSRTIARVTNSEKIPWGERSPTLGERSPSWAVVLPIWANVLQANFQHRLFMSRTFAKLSRTTAKLRWCKNDDVLTSFQDGKLGQITWAINISCFGRKKGGSHREKYHKKLKNTKRRLALQRGDDDGIACESHLSFLYSLYFLFLYFLYSLWTLVYFIYLFVWFQEAKSLFRRYWPNSMSNLL